MSHHQSIVVGASIGAAERQALAARGAVIERRSGRDRRSLGLMCFMQGALTPRRRNGRRASDLHSLADWHEPHLMAFALAILMLSVTDAFLTLTLLAHGAEEANPLLDYVLGSFPQFFAVIKMALTGAGVLILVAVARAKVFRVLRVTTIMRVFLVAYAALIGYELWLLDLVL